MTPAVRTPRDSVTQMTELVLPSHTNALSSVFGGQVVAWVDICAAITAQRHCGRTVVTASIDELEFLAPIHLGQMVCLEGRINAAFGSSMEIEVVVQVEDPCTRETSLCVQALLTFVVLDDDGKVTTARPLTLETDEDRRRAAEAAERRSLRLARRRSRRTKR